ncbi:hypothetical protein PCANC_15208 [Puccinia coronata f. sp. avenae]|uniref:Uncharacterized protein n=1 Tax=Puccinia coronata f. sp. avenae TaxID=200324 RepID=A0A2N5UFB9_9BASI|nr:hypothetical protein PCANC_15208 [Puccinia coronata f. sp. avenae]
MGTGAVIESEHVRFLKERPTQFQTDNADFFLDLKESKPMKETTTREELNVKERSLQTDPQSFDLAGTDNESNDSSNSSEDVAKILNPKSQSKQVNPPTQTLRDGS